MVNIDEVDKKILNLLQENARMPLSKIARMINISEATVHLRMRRLMKDGVLKGFRAIVNPEKVGKPLMAFVLIKAEPAKYEKALEALKEISDISEIHDVTGEYYSVLKVRAGGREELTKVIDKIGAIAGITATSTIVVLRSLKEDTKIEL